MENISTGVEYVILWFLCLVQEGALGDLAPTLDEIGRRARDQSADRVGNIVHYGLRVLRGEGDGHFKRNRTDFERCAGDGLAQNVWVELWDDDLGRDIERSLLRHFVAQGSVVAYYQPRLAHSPLASIALDSVRTTPDGEEQSAYYFLGKRHSADLRALLRDFFDHPAVTAATTKQRQVAQ